MIINITF